MSHSHAAPLAEAPLEAEQPLTLLWGTWEMWCDIPPQRPHGHGSDSTNWLEQVKSIGLFDSAEGFWGICDCTILPSQLPPNGSYYLFRKHIAPMWEHEANRRGGKWVLPFSGRVGRGDSELQAVDVAWQTLCLSAIGELFPGDEEEICGVTVSRSKQRAGLSGHAAAASSSAASSAPAEWKLCLWTRSADNETAQLRVAEYVRKSLLARPTPQAAQEDAGWEAGGSASDAVAGAVTTRSPERASAAKMREAAGLPSTITYVAHRELMEAKQEFVKGGAALAFRPKYTLSMEARGA